MTLTIRDLGALGELVGGVAIIVTLLYLAVQTRQTRRAGLTQAPQWISDQEAESIIAYLESLKPLMEFAPEAVE